ncbi:MAG: hypothetical protein ACRC35_01010 [Angustibacter sp.]
MFGENKNDALSVRELVLYLNPRLAGRVLALPRPTSLVSSAGHSAVRKWLEELGDVITIHQRRGRHVQAVLVHRDADRADPHAKVEQALTADLEQIPAARAVVPVQKIEAWWFLFPNAVEALRPRAWHGCLAGVPFDVEQIPNPDERLRHLTRKSHRYSKGDSPAIAERIRLLEPKPVGTSASFSRFTSLVEEFK